MLIWGPGSLSLDNKKSVDQNFIYAFKGIAKHRTVIYEDSPRLYTDVSISLDS